MPEKKTRQAGRPKTFNEQEALDKVIEVFWELGYDAADTETLSKRTGFSKPSLYKAFGSKQDLFVAAIKRYQEIQSRASIDILNNSSSPAEGLRDYFLNFAEIVAASDQMRGCIILSIAIPYKDRLPKVAEFLKTASKSTHVALVDYFSTQKASENLSSDFDELAAISLMQDLSSAFAVEARAGAPLEMLRAKAMRNAQLVLHVGGLPN